MVGASTITLCSGQLSKPRPVPGAHRGTQRVEADGAVVAVQRPLLGRLGRRREVADGQAAALQVHAEHRLVGQHAAQRVLRATQDLWGQASGVCSPHYET